MVRHRPSDIADSGKFPDGREDQFGSVNSTSRSSQRVAVRELSFHQIEQDVVFQFSCSRLSPLRKLLRQFAQRFVL